MTIRELVSYKWIYNNGKFIIVDKKNNKNVTMSMVKADSIARAIVSFRNEFRIEQNKKIRDVYKKKVRILQEKLHKAKEREKELKETIKKLKNKK